MIFDVGHGGGSFDYTVCEPALQVGAPADISVFDLVDGSVEFVETRRNKRSGTKKLLPWLTVKSGRPWGPPPLPIPFS